MPGQRLNRTIQHVLTVEELKHLICGPGPALEYEYKQMLNVLPTATVLFLRLEEWIWEDDDGTETADSQS